eukprot:1154143-Pelagomonas_calceolata.AAC.6
MALAMHQLKAILYTSYTSAVLSICMLWAAMQTNLGASAHGCLTPVMHHAVLASNLYAVDSFANLAGYLDCNVLTFWVARQPFKCARKHCTCKIASNFLNRRTKMFACLIWLRSSRNRFLASQIVRNLKFMQGTSFTRFFRPVVWIQSLVWAKRAVALSASKKRKNKSCPRDSKGIMTETGLSIDLRKTKPEP